jgi:hypothetical protein
MRHLNVALEHHLSQRYHAISHGPGRRPATTFGKFNLRYSPERGTLRIRQPLATKDITEALKPRKQKNEINPTEPEGNGAILKAAVTKYCAEILATKKKTTAAAYAKSVGYFLLSTGKKNLSTINREDLMEFKVYWASSAVVQRISGKSMNQSPHRAGVAIPYWRLSTSNSARSAWEKIGFAVRPYSSWIHSM